MNSMPFGPFLGPIDINSKILELEKKIEEINNKLDIIIQKLNKNNDYTDYNYNMNKDTGIYMI